MKELERIKKVMEDPKYDSLPLQPKLLMAVLMPKAFPIFIEVDGFELKTADRKAYDIKKIWPNNRVEYLKRVKGVSSVTVNNLKELVLLVTQNESVLTHLEPDKLALYTEYLNSI